MALAMASETTILTMSSQFLQPLLGAVAQRLGSGAPLLDAVGLRFDDVAAPESELTFEKLLDSWHEAIALCRDPMLPLVLGDIVHPSDFGLPGHLAQSAATLGEALELSVRYEHLVNRSFHSELLTEGDLVYDRLVLPPLPVERLRPIVEYNYAAAASFGHFLLRDPARRMRGTVAVHFRHAPAGPKSAYERFFGCPVEFNADHNQCVLSRAVLQQRMPSSDPLLLQRMIEHAEQRGSQHKQPVPEIVQKLERLIAPALPFGLPELKTIAEANGMSVSTLKRRLQEQGTNYLAVCDGLRQRLARQYVLEPERSLVDVAFLLGFSELSTFYRAFKRWTALTPQQYRRQQSESGL